jgi:putative peptidoglycan lipid II flippase
MSLVAYAVGLPAFIAVKVLAPGYFARQDTTTPVKIGLIAMAANFVMNLLFVGTMVTWGVAGPHAGLALASSAAAFLNAGLLYRGLLRSGAYQPGAGWLRLSSTVFLSCLVMIAMLARWTPDMEIWMALTAGNRAMDLVLYILSGAAIYGLTGWIAGVRPHHFSRGAH